MDRATGPTSPSPVAQSHCDGGGSWPKVAPISVHKSDRDDAEEEEGEKGYKEKRKKKKRKKETKDGGAGKWTFGGLFRRKKKKDEEVDFPKDSTEEEYGLDKSSPAKGNNFPPSPSTKRTKNEDEHVTERLAHPCAIHNGCVGCVVTSRPGRSRQRHAFGSGSDCKDSYGGTSLVRRDSSTSSHRERKELIKARVEAMRERLPKDSSSDDECLPGGSEGSWEWKGRKVPLAGGHPPSGIGSAGSSPYLGRRSRFVARTERFHQRRFSREFRDEGEEEETWRRRPNGLPPQCVPWRASQSDAEAPYIGGRIMTANCGTTTELGGGSIMSYSPAQSPLQSPILSGRRSVSSATSPPYGREQIGMAGQGGSRCLPRRFPSTPLSPQNPTVDVPIEGGHVPMHPPTYFPIRSRSTDVLISRRPDEVHYHRNELNPFHFPMTNKQQSTQSSMRESHQFHQRWPSAPPIRKSPPPPPPPRDPQRRLAAPQSLSHLQLREQVPSANEVYLKRPSQHPTSHHTQVHPQESHYMNLQNERVNSSTSGGSQGVTCIADSQPRSRRPLRVTAGGYVGRSGELSYMSDSQVTPSGRRPMPQHPPHELHYAVPFLADSPPPSCVISRVFRENQMTENAPQTSRSQVKQQRGPVFSRSRSSSPAPSGVNNRPALLTLRPFENSNESLPFNPRGHSSAPQTPIEGPIARPLSIVSEEKCEMSPKIPPVPPARSSSRRSSVSSLEAIEYGMWGMDRPSKPNNKGPSGLEDALTELENIYKSLKFEDDVDGETDSLLMGSSETGATHDDQERPLTDDMAYRRMHSKEKAGSVTQQGVGGVVAQAGSYLLVSPTLGPADPWTEPPPNSVNPGEPDITLDDVVFRSIRQANAHIPPDPQPPFGIPIGPVTRAPDSDYLHAKPPSPSPSRTSSSARKTPDLVKDDLAFRSLRKDRFTSGALVRPVPLRGISSPPPRPSSSFSCISSPPPLPNTGIDFQAIRKKRAVRSLSANLLGILQTTNLSTRPLSPPYPPKTQLPPPSPTSPRKDIRNIVLSPTPTRILTSPPPKIKPLLPPVAVSEDSESCLIEIPPQGNDATSSDTLTEGHADEPKRKPTISKEADETSVSEPVLTSPSKDSPGEVYEALGRVLSRVSKESEKGNKAESEDDDLETLLVALAREARTTSENLGRELDQLRTSVRRSPESQKKEKIESVIVREIDSSAPASPKKVAVISEIIGIPTPLENKAPASPKKVAVISEVVGVPAIVENKFSQIASPPKLGAIASLANVDPEILRLASKKKDLGKADPLNIVVGKCTVGKDINHIGIVSVMSSVSPINSGALGTNKEIESDQLRKVSTPSAEVPMKAGGVSVTVRSAKTSTVSTESAKVPIESGSTGLVVITESSLLNKASSAWEQQENSIKSTVKEVKVTPISGDKVESSSKSTEKEVKVTPISSEKVQSSFKSTEKEVKITPISCDKVQSSSDDLKKPVGFVSVVENNYLQKISDPLPPEKEYKSSVRSEPNHKNSLQKANVESATDHAELDSVLQDTAPSMESSSVGVQCTPITGSMRLLVRANTEGLHAQPKLQPNNPCETAKVSESFTESSFELQTSTVSSHRNPEIHAENSSKQIELGYESGLKELENSSKSMSPGEIVKTIQKEFDQIFAIPAKKPRKSDESEIGVDLVGLSRLHARESKSLEHPKHVRSSDQSRKTLPKSLDSTNWSRKSDVVADVFEKEFEELWKSSTKKQDERTLDSELEKQLDQLCSMKTDPKVPEVTAAVAEGSKTSPDAAAPGVDAEGEVCSIVSSGCPENNERAACTLKPAVASPACLTLGIYCPQNAAVNSPLDPATYSSMISGLFPEAGDPMFTALAAFLALVSFVAALIVRP